MKVFRIPVSCVAGVLFLLFSGIPAADGQLALSHNIKKQPIEVRLIALAVSYPRSSFFSNDEVFVAEQQLGKDESRFIKLVYDFLPYEVPLSDSGLKYSLVHKVNAVRDSSCDESLGQMRSSMQRMRTAEQASAKWKYAAESPISDLDHRQAHLRCYRTSSDDYESTLNQPTNEPPY